MTDMKLKRMIAAQAAAFPGKVAYLYQPLAMDRPQISHLSRDRVVSASTIKVPIMMAVLDRVGREHLDLSTARLPLPASAILPDNRCYGYGPRDVSLRELLYWMITVSDNTSTNVIIDWMGMDALNAYCSGLGLRRTSVQRHMLDWEAVRAGRNNYISLDDFRTCFMLLRNGPALTARYRRLALEILMENRDGGSLKRYLATGWPVAHKSGGLDDIVHDGGIFYRPGRPYFLGVFISEFNPGPDSTQAAEALIGAISRMVSEDEG